MSEHMTGNLEGVPETERPPISPTDIGKALNILARRMSWLMDAQRKGRMSERAMNLSEAQSMQRVIQWMQYEKYNLEMEKRNDNV